MIRIYENVFPTGSNARLLKYLQFQGALDLGLHNIAGVNPKFWKEKNSMSAIFEVLLHYCIYFSPKCIGGKIDFARRIELYSTRAEMTMRFNLWGAASDSSLHSKGTSFVSSVSGFDVFKQSLMNVP